MSKLKWILLIVLVLSLGLTIFVISKNKNYKSQIKALENNQTILLNDAERFRTAYNEEVVKTGHLVLTRDELLESNSHLKDELKRMKVKEKNLQTYIEVLLNSKDTAYIQVTDTIINTEKCKHLDYNNYWYQVKGEVCDSTANLELSCKHKLILADEAIYKGWWIFKRLKYFKYSVKVCNPKDTIETFNVVDVVKSKNKRKIK